MKLDAKALRYLTSEDFRVLQGVTYQPLHPAMGPGNGVYDDLLARLTRTSFL
jgi:hypothetical protein